MCWSDCALIAREPLQRSQLTSAEAGGTMGLPKQAQRIICVKTHGCFSVDLVLSAD